MDSLLHARDTIFYGCTAKIDRHEYFAERRHLMNVQKRYGFASALQLTIAPMTYTNTMTQCTM